MFYRWLNLGASPFLQISYILQFNFKIFTSCQASAGRNDIRRRGIPRTRASGKSDDSDIRDIVMLVTQIGDDLLILVTSFE